MSVMPSSVRARLVPLAACLPVAALWLSAAGILAGRPFRDDPMNPSHAIAVHDFAQAVRAIEAGAPLGDRYPSPSERDPAREATPLEEAIVADEEDLVRLLVDMGALPDPAERERVACAAQAAGRKDAAKAILRPRYPDDVCRGPLAAAAH